MKKLKLYLYYCAIFAFVCTGCTKDEADNTSQTSETAVLQLGPILNDLPDNNRQQIIPGCTGQEPGFAQISITYGPDNVEKNDIIVPILLDSNGLFTAYSEELELPVVDDPETEEVETTVSVSLQEFVVWTNNNGSPGSVIWVAPIEGSDFDQFVDQPVGPNFTFNLRAGSKNYVNVDVICYDNRDANLYGYQFFDITPVPLIKFCLFGNYCTPEGRHFVASYSVNVYQNNNGSPGDIIYSNLTNTVEGEGGEAYSDPLCFYLPDRQDVEDINEIYYVDITLLADTPGYNGGDVVIAEGPISVAEIKLLFGPMGTLDYYHFQYGCDDGVPPPFGEPTAKRYKACLKYIDSEDEVAGFAYLSLNGGTLQAVTSLFGLTPGQQHMQHIHENASCTSYGAPILPLDYENGDYPTAVMFNGVSFLNYAEIIPNVNIPNLQDRTVVVHGKMVNNSYDASAPVACGEFAEY